MSITLIRNSLEAKWKRTISKFLPEDLFLFIVFLFFLITRFKSYLASHQEFYLFKKTRAKKAQTKAQQKGCDYTPTLVEDTRQDHSTITGTQLGRELESVLSQ